LATPEDLVNTLLTSVEDAPGGQNHA
jgi:hypothetical protein